jgi:hypothetical protein
MVITKTHEYNKLRRPCMVIICVQGNLFISSSSCCSLIWRYSRRAKVLLGSSLLRCSRVKIRIASSCRSRLITGQVRDDRVGSHVLTPMGRLGNVKTSGPEYYTWHTLNCERNPPLRSAGIDKVEAIPDSTISVSWEDSLGDTLTCT